MRTSVRPAIALLFLLSSGCALDDAPLPTDDDTSGDALGKADEASRELSAGAKAYAEGFDFTADSATQVPREDAPTTGPTWVRRAFALHRAWEDNDLGVARLYRWSVDRHRVWAIRTSTDGDDSFVELFDAEGDWLATGTGGFAPDPAAPDGFVATIGWDEVLGAERDGLAPRDMSPEIAAFWAGLDAAVADRRIDLGEARAATAALVAGLPTTESIDGLERAAARRALADRALGVTPTARRHLEVALAFYQSRFRFAGNPTAPSITTALGLPSALAPRVRFARATLTGGTYADPGSSAMSQLAQRLATLPSGALPATGARLAAALRDAGATDAEAQAAVRRLGADHPDARIFAGQVFHIDERDWSAVLDPGTSWFVATPAKGFASFLHVAP